MPDSPPKGFTLSATEDGCEVLYSKRGSGGVILLLIIGVVGFVMSTGVAMFVVMEIDALFLPMFLPLFVGDFLLAAFICWRFLSVTRFSFGPEELVVERSLWRFRQTLKFRRGEIIAVRPVKDSGKVGDEESPPTWALAVMAPAEVRVLRHQSMDKSNWLGPVIATWAGVAYEPAEPAGMI